MADEIDSRMEQIRLKNEELEKKHKEILEDEREAKKQNAAIENYSGSNYKHPYDELELDFDVKDEERQEHSKNSNAKVKNTRKPILNKKSLDEIPPDPVNFLREDDGSGEANSKGDQQQQRPPQQEQQQNRNRKPPQRPRGGPYNNNKNTPNSSDNNDHPPYRPREHYQQQQQNNPRTREQHNARKHNVQENKMETQNSPATSTTQPPPRRPHPQALRNERRTISSSAVSSSNPVEALKENETNDVSPPQSNRQKRPTQQKPPRSNNKEQSDRNNLTVQINCSDEVRSVKIKSVEPRVGSGRFQHANANNLSSEGNDSLEENAQTSADGRYKNRNSNKNKRNFKPKAPQTSEFKHPILDKIVIPKTSVQERLLRSRMSEDAIPIESKVESDLSSAATPEIIEGN